MTVSRNFQVNEIWLSIYISSWIEPLTICHRLGYGLANGKSGKDTEENLQNF